MSTGGQIAGGIVGAAVGAFFGGPAGAFQGAALGMSIGGYLDPPKGPTVSGPRLSDLSVQTSTYGAFIPRVYGTIAVHGNLLWLENNKLKERVRKEEQGGKGGGGSTTVKTYTYSATFALGLCQGPIAGVRRIWCGDKLLYNAGSDDLETIIASNKNAEGWRLYLGTDDQMPDPRYEANVGVGNASAFRGIAYLVFNDFELADYSNTLQVAQFKVEVVTLQSTSVELIAEFEIPYSQPHDAISFQPSPGYISEDKVIFYSPQWDSSYPPTSAWQVFEIRPGGLSQTYQKFVIDPGSPPNGDSDQEGEAWDVSVFSGGGTFNGPDGYIQRRNEIYVGLSDLGGRKLYIKEAELVLSDEFSAYVSAYCFAVNGESIYTISPDGVRVYSKELELLSESLFSVPEMSYPSARATFYESGIYVYDGSTGIYLIDENMGSCDLVASVPEPAGINYYKVSVNIGPGMLVRAFPDSDSKNLIVQWFNLQKVNKQNIPLAEIIESEVSLSGLLSDYDIDVTLLGSSVRGYRVSGGTIRSAVEPLQGSFPFDVIPSGYKIKCVPRGQSSVVTIPWGDLGAADGAEPGDMLKQSREMDSQLPARTSITYLDAGREYAESEQYAERINTPAINRVDRELPLVITADEAAGVAEVLQNLAWLERNDISISLPPSYLPLEASDVVTVDLPEATYELRLTEINYTPNGVLECSAKPNRAALYTPNASGGEAPGPDGQVPLAGESLFIPMDIPVVDETIQNSAGFIGAMTGFMSGWPGAMLVRTADLGQIWADVQGYAGKATIGRARGALLVSTCTLIDERELHIDSISGSWDSITRDQMLSGAHYVAYGVDGRWELMRYQSADLQADGTYLLSGFIRGERGTEWASGLHQESDYVVLLSDPDLAFVSMAVDSIDQSLLWRGVTAGQSVDSAVDVNFAYRGVNLECLSPVYPKGGRDGSANFSGSFTRRSRLTGTWWTTGVPAPLGEDEEAYEIDVMSGSTVIRTIAVTSPSFSYSAADQTTDFGSPQSSITFHIYQLSSVVGRGYPLEVAL